MLALHHRLQLERRLVRQCLRQDVSRRDVDSLLEQVMLQHDEACIDCGRVAQDLIKVVDHLRDGDGAPGNVEVAGVKGGCLRNACPDDGFESHRGCDCPYTIAVKLDFVLRHSQG